MARTSAAKNFGQSRIRFIMLDAELPDGNLSQITQAIQNALRPGYSASSGRPPLASSRQIEAVEENAEEQEIDGFEEIAAEEPSVAKPRSQAPRKFRSPKVVPLDLNSDPSWEAFAQVRKPDNGQMRFLVAAAWLKRCRAIEGVTVDQIYTCFRAIRWETAIADFGAPLRGLKKRQLIDQNGKGTYAINHLGESVVDKLGGA
jgi:hypothetical protein